MKNRDDTKLYLYFSIITLVISIILGLIAFYSIIIIEPDIKRLLSVNENVSENLKEAYLKLKSPQIFAGYDNFDGIAQSIKTIIDDFDKRINNRGEFDKNDRIYLSILLERRSLGARLSRNTMIFFLLLSILGWGFYFHELRQKSAG